LPLLVSIVSIVSIRSEERGDMMLLITSHCAALLALPLLALRRHTLPCLALALALLRCAMLRRCFAVER
jgi:hypothetical protein